MCAKNSTPSPGFLQGKARPEAGAHGTPPPRRCPGPAAGPTIRGDPRPPRLPTSGGPASRPRRAPLPAPGGPAEGARRGARSTHQAPAAGSWGSAPAAPAPSVLRRKEGRTCTCLSTLLLISSRVVMAGAVRAERGYSVCAPPSPATPAPETPPGARRAMNGLAGTPEAAILGLRSRGRRRGGGGGGGRPLGARGGAGTSAGHPGRPLVSLSLHAPSAKWDILAGPLPGRDELTGCCRTSPQSGRSSAYAHRAPTQGCDPWLCPWSPRTARRQVPVFLGTLQRRRSCGGGVPSSPSLCGPVWGPVGHRPCRRQPPAGTPKSSSCRGAWASRGHRAWGPP